MLGLLISSHVFQVSLTDNVGVFRLKMSFFLIFLFIFQNFEIISLNAVKYNYQARMRQMIMNEQLINNGLRYMMVI